MSLIDIVAILGALAWVPQIISWFYNWYQKPDIKVFHDNTSEVGYIAFGNAFNIRLSFISRKKHALIDNIELILQDKDGATYNFKWIWYSETFYELQSPGGNATMARQQNAIAINAFRDVLIEKFVGFQSVAFLEKRKQLLYQLSCFIENQKRGGDIDVDNIKRSTAYNDLLNLYQSSMIWKAGKYEATCKIHVTDTGQVISHKFKFSLSDNEIVSLKNNINLACKILESDISNQQQPTTKWYWVNPNIL